MNSIVLIIVTILSWSKLTKKAIFIIYHLYSSSVQYNEFEYFLLTPSIINL